MTQPCSCQFQYLEMRPGYSIRQPFVKGRGIWAEVLYRETIGEDTRTPEQVAEDFEVPLGAVYEAIDYCQKNADFLREEHERQQARWREYDAKHPSLKPPDYKPEV
jgi:uncharacterized protein (DUF433 family)